MEFYITAGAKSFLTPEEMIDILTRYANNDWGDTCEEDSVLNNEAFETKERIVAKYIVRETDLFIISEYGHDVTTVLLANEY